MLYFRNIILYYIIYIYIFVPHLGDGVVNAGILSQPNRIVNAPMRICAISSANMGRNPNATWNNALYGRVVFPLVNVYSLRTGKSQSLIGKSTINGQFSIAMLNTRGYLWSSRFAMTNPKRYWAQCWHLGTRVQPAEMGWNVYGSHGFPGSFVKSKTLIACCT